MKAIIFTTPTCIKCKGVKKYLEEKGVLEEVVDATTDEGREKVSKMGVTAVPTVFFFENEQQIGVAHDIDEVEEIIESHPA